MAGVFPQRVAVVLGASAALQLAGRVGGWGRAASPLPTLRGGKPDWGRSPRALE